MAGSYPDAPTRRMAYDADGTAIVVARTLENLTTLGSYAGTDQTASASTWNSESDGYTSYSNFADYWWAFIFPEKRDLDGMFIGTVSGEDPKNVQTSVDTTNGYDGTWVEQTANIGQSNGCYPYFRTAIQTGPFGQTGLAGVRFWYASNPYSRLRAVHLYGEPSAGQTPNRILFLDTDAADAEFTKPQDWGDKLRGATYQKVIKLKNNSGTLTANTVQITAEALYATGSENWYEFSDDDITYQATLQLTSIAAGASPTVYINQVIPVTGSLQLHAARAYVNVASWS